MRVDFSEKFLLKLRMTMNVLNGFLNDPTAITVLRKID
jgi:hypothetical protein